MREAGVAVAVEEVAGVVVEGEDDVVEEVDDEGLDEADVVQGVVVVVEGGLAVGGPCYSQEGHLGCS